MPRINRAWIGGRYCGLTQLSIIVTAAHLTVCCGGHTGPVTKQGGDLAKAAKEAKARGEMATSVNWILDESGTEASLSQMLQIADMVVVAAVKSPAGQSNDSDWIYTWHLLRVLDRVWTAPNRKRGCQVLPKPELAIQSGEIAIPLVGGTVKIDGVAVTMTSNESSIRFEPDKRYLLMAKACADSTARLEQGEFDVFEVSSDDDLAAVSPADLPYMKEVLAFGNISQLAAHLDKERKGREAAREPLAR